MLFKNHIDKLRSRRFTLNSMLLVIFLLNTFIAFGNESIRSNEELSSSILSQPAKVDEIVKYTFNIKNVYNTPQTYLISVVKERELACKVGLSDSVITLNTNEEYAAELTVKVSDRIPVGAYEDVDVSVINQETGKENQLRFMTVREMPHPFLLVTDMVIEETKAKVTNYDWAQTNLTNMLEALNKFQFPERKIVTKPRPTKVWSSLSYVASDGEKAFQLSLAYKLTGETSYRDKAIDFVKQVCDKEEGYLSIGAATTGVQVHEGNFFLFLAAACDILYNEPAFTDDDRANIVSTFRYYLKQNKSHMNSLGIMNHQASANAGAIVAALFLQDIAEVNYLIDADGGMADQLSKGMMADGWWFESTINYCYLVTQRYILVAQAFENYGWDLYQRRFPVKFKSKDFDNAKEGFTGMKFDNWGPTGRNTRGLEDMVGAYISMMDEKAWVISSNDSKKTKPDPYYELAYRHFKTDEMAWVLQHSERDSWMSLMYGVAELPEVEDPRTQSTFAANVGITALRSQAKGRSADEQIQAYFKFGTHGGWHGQFDRTGMLALDRYGYDYFGTEMCWFGYGHPGYKECVQTSATHNMVMVDEMQQEAVPSEQTLFYAGEMMQVSVTEANARWRKIPSHNPEKFPPWDDTDFETEVIQQCRLAVVTNDYVVITDHLKGTAKHTYDCLVHPVGLNEIIGLEKIGEVVNPVNADATSPYKYFANGQWYKMKNSAKIGFQEDGIHLDVHSIWPKKANVLIANYPDGGRRQGIRNNPDRRTIAVRSTAKEQVFLQVLEPHKGESAIDKIISKTTNELTVLLKDGREQTIQFSNITDDNITVSIKEKGVDGNLKEEITH